MPAGIAPPGFHGKKGRSGRKSYADEKHKRQVIDKAWSKKDKKMSDNDATQIVLKDMTDKTKTELVIKDFKKVLDNLESEDVLEDE